MVKFVRIKNLAACGALVVAAIRWMAVRRRADGGYFYYAGFWNKAATGTHKALAMAMIS